MSYDIKNEAYSYVGLQNSRTASRSIVSSKEKLYLLEDDKVFEMNKQYEVLDTFNNDLNFCHWY